MSQYPGDRGVYPPSSISKAYSYRVGFEGTKPISKKLSLTLGVYYTKDYFKSQFNDSLFIAGSKGRISVKGRSTENYNLIETPIGIEYNIILNRKIDLLLDVSLLAGWNIGSRDTYVYDDPSTLGSFYILKPAARIPIPSSLRALGGIGIAYKRGNGWSLIFQPNYIHGLESVFDMPSNDIYYKFTTRRGSYQFLNLRLGVRRSF